jgi:thymidylate synthase (FAD)
MPTELRKRDNNKKQGSKDERIQYNGHCLAHIRATNKKALETYNYLLGHDVCPEQARAVLPQSMMTEFIETGSLAAYARLYKLRTDPHAQREIQELAEKVGFLLAERFPTSWAALTSSSEPELSNAVSHSS